MPSKAAKKSKRDALKRHGTLNPHPDAVTDPLFETSLSPLQLSASHALPTNLSSGSRLSARWPLRAIAREARTPKRPQTHAGGSGLRRATSGERPFAAPSGLGSCHPRAVLYKCTSTEYRTRTKAAGKKTSLNPVGGVRKPAERETLISAYEDLRRQAAQCSIAGGLGMAIFLGQGMVAWMLACSWVASTNPHNVHRCPISAAPLPDELRAEIVLVLAAMALKQAAEVHP